MTSGWAVVAALALTLGAATACDGSSSPLGSDGCQRDTQCPTYVCNCVDSTSVQRRFCDPSGNCADAAGVCDGCSTRGGAAGPVQTIPAEEPIVGPADAATGSDAPRGDAGADADACDLTEFASCYEPVAIQQGSLATWDSDCGDGLSFCGTQCRLEQYSGKWCCPTGYECLEDAYHNIPKCQDGTDALMITCLPPNVVRCHYTPQEAHTYTNRADLGCIQHFGDQGLVYNCDVHRSPFETKCVATEQEGSSTPLCPEQSAACVPTGP